jgi:hypothetical protein
LNFAPIFGILLSLLLKFVALRVATETIKALHYKLYMMGVPLDGPANILVDNDSIFKNSTIPSSTLQRKHNAICYHCVRESVKEGILHIAYIPSGENLVDSLTKILGATKLKDFCSKLSYCWKLIHSLLIPVMIWGANSSCTCLYGFVHIQGTRYYVASPDLWYWPSILFSL